MFGCKCLNLGAYRKEVISRSLEIGKVSYSMVVSAWVPQKVDPVGLNSGCNLKEPEWRGGSWSREMGKSLQHVLDSLPQAASNYCTSQNCLSRGPLSNCLSGQSILDERESNLSSSSQLLLMEGASHEIAVPPSSVWQASSPHVSQHLMPLYQQEKLQAEEWDPVWMTACSEWLTAPMELVATVMAVADTRSEATHKCLTQK